MRERCLAIELILSDVDGVLTEGGVIYDDRQTQIMWFHIRDGLGIKLWQGAGKRFGIISGRSSAMVAQRAAELDVTLVRQGAAKKLPVYRELLSACGLAPAQACYIGDDLPDLPLVRDCGLGVAVADAAPELRASAHFVTTRPGGRGAVREVIERILQVQGRWEDCLRGFDS